MHDAVKNILVTEEQIIERCKELGKQIKNDYDETPIDVANPDDSELIDLLKSHA